MSAVYLNPAQYPAIRTQQVSEPGFKFIDEWASFQQKSYGHNCREGPSGLFYSKEAPRLKCQSKQTLDEAQNKYTQHQSNN